MDVITEGWPEDGKDQILLEEITCKYYQNPDCTEDREAEPQELILSTRDGGGGKFLHIKTGSNGWSITTGEEFLKIIKDFSKRLGAESIMHS